MTSGAQIPSHFHVPFRLLAPILVSILLFLAILFAVVLPTLASSNLTRKGKMNRELLRRIRRMLNA